MITPYIAQQPVTDFGLGFPSLKYSASLAATTDTTLTIPGNSPRYKAIIKCETDGNVWIALNATAAVPAGATFASTTSELITGVNYICREVKAGDVIHCYTASANTDVSITLYAVGTNN